MPIEFTITLTSPLHHGAGTSGNTAVLRTDELRLPDGTRASVPTVSANSVRHGLRDALAWHLAETLDIPDGALHKQVVDLLWSGGALTESGSQTDLDRIRDVETLQQQLSLLGYSARSDLSAGMLRVQDLRLVCAENAWRLPARLADSPQGRLRAAAFRGEAFGTRHDISSTPAARYIDTLAATSLTTQMIYDLQVLLPGSVLYGSLGITPAGRADHRRVLDAAISLWAPGGHVHLAAKTAVGYGEGLLSGYEPDPAALDWWTDHIAGHRDAILALLDRVAVGD